MCVGVCGVAVGGGGAYSVLACIYTLQGNENIIVFLPNQISLNSYFGKFTRFTTHSTQKKKTRVMTPDFLEKHAPWTVL